MTLYAGNSLTGAIYKGSELICQTGGATADMIAVGNQLRRAEAYYRTEDVGGKYYFYEYPYSSYRFGPYDNCPKIGFIYSQNAYIIDGKLYKISNNELVRLTGTNTGKDNFVFVKGNIFFDSDGYSYYSSQMSTDFTKMTSFPRIYDENSSRIIVGDRIDRWMCYVVIDGALYKFNNNGSNQTLIDNGGIWTHLFIVNTSWVVGIRDGYICVASDTDGVIQSTIRPYLSWTDYTYNHIYYTLADDKKTLKRVLCKQTSIDTPQLIKTISNDIVKGYSSIYLDSAGNCYNGGSLLDTNVTDISSRHSGNHAYIKNNKLYYGTSKTQSPCMSDLSLNGFANSWRTNVVKVNDGYIREETFYCTSNATKAYANPRISQSTSIQSKTSTTVTVNNNVYARNQSKDSYFEFIPDDLKNKTFTDADLLDACLSAGLNLNS